MEVILAEHAGFCRGVKSALELTINEVAGGKKVSTFGPLVHNQDVADYLAEKNVQVINSLNELAEGVVVVRTHGVGPETLEILQNNDRIEVINATCSYVKKVQHFVHSYAQKGHGVIILGDERHPEVQALFGWSGNKALIIGPADIEQAEELLQKKFFRHSPEHPPDQLVLLSQTTQQEKDFFQLAGKIGAAYPQLQVINTICSATRLRQEKALELSAKVDLMLVIGDPSSSNTSKLTKACAEKTKTYQISGAGDILKEWLIGVQNVGVVAGASTPEWTIKEVLVTMEKGMENGSFDAKKEEFAPETEELTNAEAPFNDGEGLASDADAEEPASGVEAPTAEAEASAEAEVSVSADAETDADAASDAQAAASETEDPSEAEVSAAEAEEFAKGLEEYAPREEEITDYRMGDVVKGKIALIEDDQILIDIGYKVDAFLPKGEVFLEDGGALSDKYSVGDDVDLLILRVYEQEDKVIVSAKRLERERRWKEMEDALESGKNMKGVVKEIVPAGIIVNLGSGIEGFMPGSLVDVRYIPDFQQFLGQDFTFKIIELNWERDKVILSRKHALSEEIEKTKKETIQNLQVGAVIIGVVKRLTDFGAFVDVGGIDGLVHISEVSWQRIGHPRDVLKVGDEVHVKILEIVPEKEKISLSIRQGQPNPWSLVEQDFAVNQIVSGKVTRIVTFGAFVELTPGVEGLVHISQLADFHVKHPSEVLQEGEEVEAKILEINLDNKRISLSIKEARPAPRDYSNQMQTKDNGSDGNVTLGDVFGALFKKDK